MSSGQNSNSLTDAVNNQAAFTSTSLSTPPASTSTAKLSAKHQQQFTFQLNSNAAVNSASNNFKFSSSSTSSTSSLASISNELNQPHQYSNMPVNPFEETNRFRLEQSVLSPNLFHVAHTSTPERDTKSLWNIDQRAVLYPADIPTDESSLIAQYVYDYKLNKQLTSAVEAFWTQNKIIIESPLTNSMASNALRQKFAAVMNSNNKTATASGSSNRHAAANAATAKKNSYSVNSPFGIELKNSCSSANRYAASASSTSSAATSYRTSNMTAHSSSTKSLAKSSLASNKRNQSCQTTLSIPSNFDLSKISALKAFMLPDDDNSNELESPNKQQLNNSIRKKLFDHNSDDLSSASTTTTATQHFEINTLPKPEFYSNQQSGARKTPNKNLETNENNNNNNNNNNSEKLKPIVSSSSSTNDWRDSFEIDDHQFASSPYDKYTNIIHDIGDYECVDDLNDSVFMPTSQHRAPAPDLSPLLATPKKQNNYFHLTGDKSSNKTNNNRSPGEKLLGSPDLSPIKLNMNEADDDDDDDDDDGIESVEKKTDSLENGQNDNDESIQRKVNNHNYQNGTSSKTHRSKTKKINYEDIFNHSASNGVSNKSIIFMDVAESQSNSNHNQHHSTHTNKQTALMHTDDKHHACKRSIENLNRMEEDETNSNHAHRRDDDEEEQNEDLYNSTNLNSKNEHSHYKHNDQSSTSMKQQLNHNRHNMNKSTNRTVNTFMDSQQNKLIETIIETTSTFNQDSQDTGYQTTTSAMGANGNNSNNSGSSSSYVQSFINTTNTNNSNFNTHFHQQHLGSKVPTQNMISLINNSNSNKIYSIFDTQMFKSLNQQAQVQQQQQQPQNTVTSTPMSMEEDEWQFSSNKNQYAITNNNLITSYFNINMFAKNNTKSFKFHNESKMLNLSANRSESKAMNNSTKFKKSSSVSLNSLETIQPVESSTPEKMKMSFQKAKLNEFKMKFLKANGVNLVSSTDSTTFENKYGKTRLVKSKSSFSALKDKKSNDSNSCFMNDENHLQSQHNQHQAKSINDDDAYMSFNNSFECNSIEKKASDCYNYKHVLAHNKNLINNSNEKSCLRMNKSSVADGYFIGEDLAIKKQEIDSSFVDQSILQSKLSPSQYAMNVMAKAKQDLNESFKYALESKSLSTTTLTTKSSTSTAKSSETKFSFL